VLVLQQIDVNLWTATQPMRALGMDIGARMTIVRLASGGLFVHAPIRLTPELKAALDDLGPVEVAVAPNAMHHLFLGSFLAFYPAARGYAAPGAAAKNPGLSLTPIPATPPPLWSADLDHAHLEGLPKLDEFAFFHRASRTLILTDFVFYFQDARSFLLRLYLRLAGAIGKPVQTSILKSMVKDRAAARATVDRLLAWDFDRVIMSHRDILERGGKQALQQATAWLSK
jgi:hypothetical protein